MAEVLLSKRVQEMVLNGEEPPTPYVSRHDFDATEDDYSTVDVLQEFTDKMKMLTELTSKAMAKSLQLEENCFLDQFGERETLHARFNYYPKCQRPDLILGLKPHADGSGYTVILQDEVGLQIFNDDKWHTVPKVPHAILILMGDQMESLLGQNQEAQDQAAEIIQ
ncbi:hypothetical protein Vadar_032393 [Vaccinium darrowii]|uniref:Uncharacterized protein n=1 Tax=Vaccinium darrowii TaxID=229202 RepID=A0ACB7ZN86_9ERIC|nr:hypothetical protein Vadar_032393 [Vaccinium darrowii]